MSAQLQMPPTDSNVYSMSGISSLAPGWESWPDGVYLVISRDSGRPLLQPIAAPLIDADYWKKPWNAAIREHNEKTLAEALTWAAAAEGKMFPVFPCMLRWNAEKQKVAKKPTMKGGFKNASILPAEITALWEACTDKGIPAVIGLRCKSRSTQICSTRQRGRGLRKNYRI